MTCLGSCFIYGAWTLFTEKERRLDTEIKRTQNAPFHIPQTGNECDMMDFVLCEQASDGVSAIE